MQVGVAPEVLSFHLWSGATLFGGARRRALSPIAAQPEAAASFPSPGKSCVLGVGFVFVAANCLILAAREIGRAWLLDHTQ